MTTTRAKPKAPKHVKYVTYYPNEHVLYVKLSDAAFVRGQEIDDHRYLNLGEDDVVLGIEFLDVDNEINLSDVPEFIASSVRAVLEQQRRLTVAG